jgi:hypothetical protein
MNALEVDVPDAMASVACSRSLNKCDVGSVLELAGLI